MSTVDWICKACNKNCRIQTEAHIKPYKCVYFELSMPHWEPLEELSLNQKMEKVMRLYPMYKWKIEMSMTRDEGGNRVSQVSAGFGEALPDEDWPSFSPIVIDENGELLELENSFTTIPTEAYEAFRCYIDTDIDFTINELCDEILKRNQKRVIN